MALTDDKAQQQIRIVLGHVDGVYGVQGWVKLHSYTDPRVAILEYSDCQMKTADEWRPARISEGKAHGKGVIARIDGIDDRDAAALCIGAEIAVLRKDLPEPEDGHYYWADLEGLRVVHRDGAELGRVAYLLATGANDVLVVQGEREILIPFVPGSVVLEVDLSQGSIRVDWEWD